MKEPFKCPILQAAFLSGDDFTRMPHVTKNTDTNCMGIKCAWYNRCFPITNNNELITNK